MLIKDLVNQKGQTLLEMIIVITTGVIIVGALTFATIGSLRNADFSKSQIQATKLAQEALENTRTIRDRNLAGRVLYTTSEGDQTSTFSDLFAVDCPSCYFYLSHQGQYLNRGTAANFETIADRFKRQIIIKGGAGSSEKKVTAVVEWIDSRGETHKSEVATILRKIY